MCLPYWNSELDVEAGAWTYASSARGTLSAARLHSPQLEELSALALALDSELLYLYGKTCGAAGSMLENDNSVGNVAIADERSDDGSLARHRIGALNIGVGEMSARH